jgi:hypothetical protein
MSDVIGAPQPDGENKDNIKMRGKEFLIDYLI